MIANYLSVALGSAVGGMARLAAGVWMQERLSRLLPGSMTKPFPIGTLLVNASGSFLIGILIVAMARRTAHANLIYYLLIVGFCGGYTTFSTFSADTVALVESGASWAAALNVVISVSLACVATFLGFALARAALGRPA